MNNTLSRTSSSIDDEYMVFPYNDHSSPINDILIHHNHQFPSPFSQFEFVPDFALLGSLLPQNNDHVDNQIIPNPLLPLNNPTGDQPNIEPSETITHIEDSHRLSASSQAPKMKKGKKPSRTDRHSKIKTAKGTRDRRMRLSLDVAKELFGLQDMLGFDKASKTVEWLLTQAKPEIIKIANTFPHQFNLGSFSSGDESQTLVQGPALGSMDKSSDLCELPSIWTVEDRGSNINTTETRGNNVDGRSMRGKRKRLLQPRTPLLKKLSKEARAKARERAKDRTKEKMMIMRRSQANVLVEEEANDHNEMIKSNRNNVNSNLTSFEEELCKKDRFTVGNQFMMNQEYHHTTEGSYDIIKKLKTAFPILNHHCTHGGAGSIQQQQHQFMDRNHFFQKSRDPMYNYQNMC